MRIIVDSPKMFLAALIVRLAFAIYFPVRDAVNRVRVRLFVGLLQSAPDVVPDIVLNGGDLFLIRKGDILGRNIRRFAQRRIIARHGVRLQSVEIVRAAQHLVLHVPLRIEAVIPALGIFPLFGRHQEMGAFLD